MSLRCAPGCVLLGRRGAQTRTRGLRERGAQLCREPERTTQQHGIP